MVDPLASVSDHSKPAGTAWTVNFRDLSVTL